MSYNLDATTDYSYKELYTYLGTQDIPEYVKEAEVLTKSAADELDKEAFADENHRAYPINSKANVYLSNAYFFHKHAAIAKKWGKNFADSIQAKITKAAEILGVTEDLARYNARTTEKQAADYTEQDVARFDVGSKEIALFPFKTASDLEKLAHVFADNIKSYPFDWRAKIASSFLEKAEAMGVTHMPEILSKYAGFYFPDTRILPTEFNRRMKKVGAAQQPAYEEIVKKAGDVKTIADCYALCKQAYVLEKQAGLYDNAQVYRVLGDPVDRCFVLSIAKVAETLNVIDMAGTPYSVADLQSVPKDIYKQAFGVDLDPSDVSSLRDTLPTMPLSDVALFTELSGIKGQ